MRHFSKEQVSLKGNEARILDRMQKLIMKNEYDFELIEGRN